jgi:hypothetical protein
MRMSKAQYEFLKSKGLRKGARQREKPSDISQVGDDHSESRNPAKHTKEAVQPEAIPVQTNLPLNNNNQDTPKAFESRQRSNREDSPEVNATVNINNPVEFAPTNVQANDADLESVVSDSSAGKVRRKPPARQYLKKGSTKGNNSVTPMDIV